MKILPVRAELFHADRRTDGQTAKSRFLQFYESAQKCVLVRTIASVMHRGALRERDGLTFG